MSSDPLTNLAEENLRRCFDEIPFARLLGLELIEISQGFAKLRLPVRDELKRNRGLLHGAATAGLIDTAAAIALMTVTGIEQLSATIDLTIHYLRPITEGFAIAEARTQRVGKRLAFISVEVRDISEVVVATGVTTYAQS